MMSVPEETAVKIQNANVRLINAAPTLYSALRKLLTEALAIHGDDLADARTIDAARAALALATEPSNHQEDGE